MGPHSGYRRGAVTIQYSATARSGASTRGTHIRGRPWGGYHSRNAPPNTSGAHAMGGTGGTHDGHGGEPGYYSLRRGGRGRHRGRGRGGRFSPYPSQVVIYTIAT